jgi:hypothetical protein
MTSDSNLDWQMRIACASDMINSIKIVSTNPKPRIERPKPMLVIYRHATIIELSVPILYLFHRGPKDRYLMLAPAA